MPSLYHIYSQFVPIFVPFFFPSLNQFCTYFLPIFVPSLYLPYSYFFSTLYPTLSLICPYFCPSLSLFVPIYLFLLLPPKSTIISTSGLAVSCNMQIGISHYEARNLVVQKYKKKGSEVGWVLFSRSICLSGAERAKRAEPHLTRRLSGAIGGKLSKWARAKRAIKI